MQKSFESQRKFDSLKAKKSSLQSKSTLFNQEFEIVSSIQ